MNKVLSRNHFRNFCGGVFVLVYTADVAEGRNLSKSIRKGE